MNNDNTDDTNKSQCRTEQTVNALINQTMSPEIPGTIEPSPNDLLEDILPRLLPTLAFTNHPNTTTPTSGNPHLIPYSLPIVTIPNPPPLPPPPIPFQFNRPMRPPSPPPPIPTSIDSNRTNRSELNTVVVISHNSPDQQQNSLEESILKSRGTGKDSTILQNTISNPSQKDLSTGSNKSGNANFSLQSVGSVICRICHNSDTLDRLISPCYCKGTLAYVHRACLEHWLSRAGILHCELCMYRFQTEHTLRYTCCESLRIWYNHPNNRGLLQSDFMVCSLLTIVTFGLVSMSVFGLQYLILQGNRFGLPKFWTQGTIIVFLLVVLLAYMVNVVWIIKGQISPWYRWWQSARHVRLILSESQLSAHRQLRERGSQISHVNMNAQSLETPALINSASSVNETNPIAVTT